jgi:hypothetical protein
MSSLGTFKKIHLHLDSIFLQRVLSEQDSWPITHPLSQWLPSLMGASDLVAEKNLVRARHHKEQEAIRLEMKALWERVAQQGSGGMLFTCV